MKCLIIALSTLFIFSGCISNRYIKGTSFKNTLLYQNKDSVSFYPSHKVALWKPTKKDIRKAELLMQEHINKRKLLKNLQSYSRQYIGIIESGKKIIRIEGVCVDPKEFFPDWKHHIIRVDDGGNCFWGINVDLNLEECYGFSINSAG